MDFQLFDLRAKQLFALNEIPLFEHFTNVRNRHADRLHLLDYIDFSTLGIAVVAIARFRVDMIGRNQPLLFIKKKRLLGNVAQLSNLTGRQIFNAASPPAAFGDVNSITSPSPAAQDRALLKKRRNAPQNHPSLPQLTSLSQYHNNIKKRVSFETRYLDSGGDLISRAVSSQVPSALRGLTSVFGMGTGGTLSPLPPETVYFSILTP